MTLSAKALIIEVDHSVACACRTVQLTEKPARKQHSNVEVIHPIQIIARQMGWLN